MKSFILALAAVAAALPGADAAAQCCAAGNPVNTNCGPAAGGAGVLTVATSYMHSSSDTYYSGTRRLDTRYAQSYYDYASLALSYGVSGALRLTADLGYYFDKAQRFVTSGGYTRYARGVSDATLGLAYTTYASPGGFSLVQTARVTMPVGAFDQQYDGVILPIDFQPSSGAWRWNLGVALSQSLGDGPFSVMSLGSVEFSQAIRTATTYHRYGNLYNVSVLGVYRASPALQGTLQLRWEMRDRALTGTIDNLPPPQSHNNQYAYLNASGGVIAYVSPQVSAVLFNGWTCSLQYNVPFYRNVYGEQQLTNRSSVAVNLSRAIDFGGARQELPPEAEPRFPSLEMRVRGNCDMCKSRIETTAAAVPLVRSAEWNPSTGLLTVRYTGAKPDRDAIERALAAAGHDTEHHAAPDDVYEKLPACCHYRK